MAGSSRPLASAAEVAEAGEDDDLIVWAAQGMRPGVRAWALGDAVAVASPGASRRDRLAVRGSMACALPLVRHALAEAGPTYRPLGDAELVRAVSAGVEGMTEAVGFSWMVTRSAPPPPPPWPESAGGGAAGWLGPDADPEIAALLAGANPSSYAVPGIDRVSRWAGVRDVSGAVVAVAADAWSAPTVGLMAGVATAAPARGRGLAERVCRFVTRALVAEHGRAALMVDDWNDAAIRLYERLGYARRRVAALAPAASAGPRSAC
ncbi:GNAT family N-acetyltransferase [Microtetraspora malaysiensis]|uniref:GNAT family N-acetyltransferase n=1 Tax=Microtetraspora malaysiensis TaxID=161358 RepID=UPI000830F632|nr:GNAT family N-acetyltransferase [Microtetraspora malaysiensis]